MIIKYQEGHLVIFLDLVQVCDQAFGRTHAHQEQTISRPGTPSSSKSIRIPSSILSSVVDAISIKHEASIVPAVCDGGDHQADAGPAGTDTAEGRVESEAPGGVCSGDSHWQARAVGGTPPR
ncbi:hypothetical protein Q3G72_032881 [Acer saccharum]|nr:hypothetical protein Q3G72_032881 [Acer saccharum]